MTGIIVLAVTAVGVIAAMAGRASASVKRGEGGRSVPPPVSLPERSLPLVIQAAIESIAKGTATPEMIALAIEEAENRGLDTTVETLRRELDILLAVKIPALVKAPDRPGMPIPKDPKSGKTFWFFDTRGGERMVIPRYRSILVQFQTLQEALGIPDDGRIGPDTLEAFIERTSGFAKAPRTLEDLAANAVKWAEIIRHDIPAEHVGGGFSQPPNPWEVLANANVKKLQSIRPKVEEKLGNWVGQPIIVNDAAHTISLSGLLGIVDCAGFKGAKSWLENESDRSKYPNTTNCFLETNNLF